MGSIVALGSLSWSGVLRFAGGLLFYPVLFFYFHANERAWSIGTAFSFCDKRQFFRSPAHGDYWQEVLAK